MKGLILDLRDNPGGALPAAIEMADMFLESGDILSVRPRSGGGRTWSATAGDTLKDFPMLVMVNGQSASASEIVAGALQDNGRAKVLGTRTFGKGSVQEVRELDYNRGTLKYTNAYYYLPSGRNLHRRDRDQDQTWGVDPDPGLVITETDEEYVAHLLARRPYEVIKDRDDELPDCFGSAWIREHFQDEQLASAVDVLTRRVTTGEWTKVTDVDPAVAALENDLDRLNRARSRLLQQLEQVERSMSAQERLAAEAGRAPVVPADVDLTEGTLVLRDREGKVIGEFRITDADAALALNAMRLTPVAKDE